jgi:methylmalonyl-CoA mutase
VLEAAFTRHAATTRLVSGIYGAEYADDESYARVQGEIAAFAKDEGRPPRMLVAKLGQDGHDRGAKVIATAFADLGFAVEIGPLFQTPEEAAREAVQKDVDVIGVSSLAAGHTTLVPALIATLKAEGGAHIRVALGGVIPPQDYAALKAAGVGAIFGPGTNVLAAASEILKLIQTQRAAA